MFNKVAEGPISPTDRHVLPIDTRFPKGQWRASQYIGGQPAGKSFSMSFLKAFQLLYSTQFFFGRSYTCYLPNYININRIKAFKGTTVFAKYRFGNKIPRSVYIEFLGFTINGCFDAI